jgi:hypothetical protein
MPKNGVLGVAVALNVVGFGATEVSAACDGPGGCRGYGYAPAPIVYAPPPIVYAPPPVYAYYPPPGAYYGVVVGYGYPSPQYFWRRRLLRRSPL